MHSNIFSLFPLAKKKWRHKERVTLTISWEGIRIEDETTQKVQHTHPVKRILFVTPDPDDKKIFGYVCSQPDCSTGYELYALKSENAKIIIDAITVLLVESVNLRRRTGSAKKQVPSNSSNENQTEQEQLREEVNQLQEKEGMNGEVGELEEQLARRDQEKNELERNLSTAQQILRDNQAQRSLEMDCQEAHFYDREREREQELREMAHQLIEKEQKQKDLRTQTEQRLREEMIEEATRLGEQLRERDQQIENFQMQLQGLREQLREKEQHLANARTQVEEQELLRTDFQHQLGVIVAENANLRQQVVNLDNHTGLQPHDWVISRDDIQFSDKSLGVGGWGEVFEGRYCGCSVAVKRIHEAINSPHNQSLFKREIDIASRCRHPCLLQFIGATNDEEIPLFVTELMESNLRELLGQRPLSCEEITVISLDVARALNYLHQKKPFPIFHRDVSSGNVLLWRRGDQWRGKVSDYGSAKFEEQCMSIGPGCFAYSAPEVQIPAKQTAKIDVYSFGVLLCEMCIQTFPDYQNRELQIAQMTNQVLQDLVRRCVRYDPTERPDMTEIISTLEEFNKTL
ncbi:probable serine/threonine-protein kinase DDB_G0281745 [Pocillopora verrucosa]|uniref:probable serine/threonine-protein kinase DDB_G0281745 n=1 Tax=Pocillopora verrucosa TaxID=203993 RepID=UPI0033417B73